MYSIPMQTWSAFVKRRPGICPALDPRARGGAQWIASVSLD